MDNQHEKDKNNSFDEETTQTKDTIESKAEVCTKKDQIENDSTGINFILADEKVQESPSQDAIKQDDIDDTLNASETKEESADKALFEEPLKQETTSDHDCDSSHFENGDHGSSQATQKHEKTSHINAKSNKKYRTPLLVASCLLLGGVGGFGGALLANNIGIGGSKNVTLQTVERTDSEGNSVTNMSVKDVVANTANSVVEITTESATTDTFMQQYVTKGAGSGVIISKDGYIVTNNHVVDGASKVTVRTKDGTEYNATLIGRDEKTDLAVIKIDATDLTPAVLGNSSNLAVGDAAIAIGNPLGELGGTVTEGIISALDREITIDGQSMTLLQTDTAINSGNSGGGLFNSAGELIGIVNAKSSGSSVEGLGFAIPIDTAKPVIESLIADGYVSGRPQLGVSVADITSETSAFQAGVNETGVYIAKVNNDSAAADAGLKVKDRIISIDGQEISSAEEITKYVDSKKVGDTISIVISRDGKEQTIKATLKEAQQVEEDTSNSNSQKNQNNDSRLFQ